MATPSDLISDRIRTPFDIDTAIELTGFTLEKATLLVADLKSNFSDSQAVLHEILNWTGGQPSVGQNITPLNSGI